MEILISNGLIKKEWSNSLGKSIADKVFKELTTKPKKEWKVSLAIEITVACRFCNQLEMIQVQLRWQQQQKYNNGLQAGSFPKTYIKKKRKKISTTPWALIKDGKIKIKSKIEETDFLIMILMVM